ncbi:MAG: acetate uptake transporter [Acidimicrobiales bacterium]
MAQQPPGAATAAFTGSVAGKPIAERPVTPDISIADPAPLGLAGFAMTTFVLGVSDAHVWPATNAAVALALAYGGLAQLLAGMWEFKRNNTFGALAFTSYGAFWISYFVFVEFIAKSIPPADVASTIGTYLLAWGIFTAYMTIASLRVSVAVVVVFVLLTIAYAILAFGAFQANVTLTKVGGWFAVATAAAAWYASFAGVTNSTFKKVVLPVVPLAR